MKYQAAAALAEEKLRALKPALVTEHTGTFYENGMYSVPWFGEKISLAGCGEAERVLFLHYLTSEGARRPTGKWISYREIPGGLFYETKVRERAVRPLVKRFGPEPEALWRAGEALRGTRAAAGDYAVTVFPFPWIPITYVLWAGDEEFPADGNLLFDQTAAGWLNAEDLAVLSSLGTYKLIKNN